MKVYDCFGFNDENHLLEIRLNEMDKYVDYFIIIEFGETHQGKPKTKNINTINLMKGVKTVESRENSTKILKYYFKNF